MHLPRSIGETTITGKNQISVPARAMRELGGQRGDRIVVKIFGDDILLMRRPEDWAEAFSGRMGDVFGDHEDTLRYLDEERRSWERD